jgi:hypothetical protein
MLKVIKQVLNDDLSVLLIQVLIFILCVRLL